MTAPGGSPVNEVGDYDMNRSRRHPRLTDTLGDTVAVLGHFARAFGRETNKTVLANVASRLARRPRRLIMMGPSASTSGEAPPFQRGSPA
jgi:hypothetical protein